MQASAGCNGETVPAAYWPSTSGRRASAETARPASGSSKTEADINTGGGIEGERLLARTPDLNDPRAPDGSFNIEVRADFK